MTNNNVTIQPRALTPCAVVPSARFSQHETYNASLDYFHGDELAASTFASKYALKDPKAHSCPYAELTPHDMHRRLAREIAMRDVNASMQTAYKLFDDVSVEHRDLFEQREALYHETFAGFKYIVPQGSPMYGIGNPYVRTSISNCVVVQSPSDNLPGIIGTTGAELGVLFSYRCGVGLDISTLRPDGVVVSNSAQSSTGAWSFADYYSYVCRMIGQNGRRGALMLTMSIVHPDIDKFVVMKHDLTKVTGANVSVMVSDAFMEAMERDDEWLTKWPVATVEELGITECDVQDLMSQGGYWKDVAQGPTTPLNAKLWVSNDGNERRTIKVFKARELWRLINASACRTAEPGILLWDNYIRNLPAHCYPQFKTISTNPCSELGLSAFDSCRLASINLKSFVVKPYTANARFDYNLFDKMSRLGMRVMDALVDIEIDYLQNIHNSVDNGVSRGIVEKLITAAKLGRRTGLGTHGLADALSGLCMRYDSDEALVEVERIYETFRNAAYDESVEMAIERGPFPVFDWATEKDCVFIQRLPQWLQDKIAIHGRRNISLLTMAPTGSVSIISQTSSGVEPVFMYHYMRRKKVNPSDPHARVDFVDDSGDKWEEYCVLHHALTDYLETDSSAMEAWQTIQTTIPKSKWSEELGKLVPPFFAQASDILGSRRVEIQGVIQKYIDHGISSTINLPKGTTPDQVEALYHLAWQHGLKGVTVYVDGSRSGVLVAAGETKTAQVNDNHAPPRPRELECDIHRSKIDGGNWLILVGKMEGRPFEVFGGEADHVGLPERFRRGRIRKRKCDKMNLKGRFACYDLVVGDGNDERVVEDIVSTFNDGDHAHETRMISGMLRHGMPLAHVADILGRDQDRSMFSFSKVMARVMKKYVNDGASSGEKCAECGVKMVFEGGCLLCRNCGASPKCG